MRAPTITGLLQNPIDRIVERWDFIRSADVADWTAAAGTVSQESAAGGVMRLLTGASDNNNCELQLDKAPLVLPVGRTVLAAVFNTISDVDNTDFGFGFATDDTDWLGDAATATELLFVGFVDAGTSTGRIQLTLFYKNASGSGSSPTGLFVNEGTSYMIQLMVDKRTTTVGAVTVACTKVETVGTGQTVSVVPTEVFTADVPNVPSGLVNISIGIQAGEAAAKTLDVDWVSIDAPRYSA